MAPEVHGDTAPADATTLDTPECPPEGSPPPDIIEAFEWASLCPQNATIVDLGDATGAQCIVLARSFSNLRFVIQDNREALAIARKNWAAQPDVEPRAQFQEIAFGDPQPDGQAPAVFLLHYTIDNLSDNDIINGLRILRAAAQSGTILLIFFNRPASASSSAPSVADSFSNGLYRSESTADVAGKQETRVFTCSQVNSFAASAGWAQWTPCGPSSWALRFLAA